METELKIGDKIVVVSAPKREIGKFYNIGDIGIIQHMYAGDVIVNFNDQNNTKVYSKGVSVLRRECIMKCSNQETKPRFHAAQQGDLLWNDDLGICTLENIVNTLEHPFPIKVSSDNGGDTITLEGKRCKNSPKATFFYYTPENHYLTERPEPEVDWSKVSMNTQVFVSDGELVDPQNAVSFFGYFPELERPFWIFIGMTEENAEGFKFCKLAEPCKPEWRK